MENYTRVIGATSTNIRTPSVGEIAQGNDTLTPFESDKNNGYTNEMSQGLNNVSTEVVNVIIAAGLTPDGTLAQLNEAIGILAQDGFKLASIQVFSASGTWNKPAGINAVHVKLVGGGGGGSADQGAVGGGGGGAGGYSEEFITSGLGASETVTIGAGGAGGTFASTGATFGGTTSFGSFLSATGGSADAGPGVGAVGGAGAGGDINLSGGRGSYGADNDIGGGGGNTVFGGGGGASGSAGLVGAANTGGGGGGGDALSSANGGAGGSGFVIVYEYK